VKKTSYAHPTPLRRDRECLQSIKNKRAYLFKLKVKSLVSDVMLLFSDFREKLLAGGYVFSPCNDPRTLRVERDKYLADVLGPDVHHGEPVHEDAGVRKQAEGWGKILSYYDA
jgi:hypothetical protein